MAQIRTFRDLIAWQRAMSLARSVYAMSKKLPESERFGLAQQMRRAAVSIPSNIAEGYARQSTRDYIKFLRVARGSLAELATQIELASSMNLVTPDPETLSLVAETDRVLQGLIRSLTDKLPGAVP